MLKPRTFNPQIKNISAAGFCIAAAAAELAVISAAGIAISLFVGRSRAASKRAAREKLRAELLRSAAHDIRTPLSAIKLSAQMLANTGGEFSVQDRTELLRGIDDSVNRLTLMSENILTLTREDFSRQSLRMRPELAEEVISEAALSFRRLHGGISVMTSVPEEPVEIIMDAQLIEQVMQNLLENAALHGEADKIEITVEAVNGYAVFCFSDNGSGIPDAVLGNLFKELSANDRTEGARSMGTGLSLCKMIIGLHGGSLSGRNTDNGAEFTFTLPLEKH